MLWDRARWKRARPPARMTYPPLGTWGEGGPNISYGTLRNLSLIALAGGAVMG